MLLCSHTHTWLWCLVDLEASSCRLTVNSDVMDIMHAMSAPDSGLEIRDRMWLKITIPNAFIGKFAVFIIIKIINNNNRQQH